MKTFLVVAGLVVVVVVNGAGIIGLCRAMSSRDPDPYEWDRYREAMRWLPEEEP